jgi:hypothetical protein
VERNAPLHLFSASPELVGFGQSVYHRRSELTSMVLGQLFERFRTEGIAMAFTIADFQREYMKEHLPKLTPEERLEVLEQLPLKDRLAGLSAEQILNGLSDDEISNLVKRAARRKPANGKARRKKK